MHLLLGTNVLSIQVFIYFLMRYWTNREWLYNHSRVLKNLVLENRTKYFKARRFRLTLNFLSINEILQYYRRTNRAETSNRYRSSRMFFNLCNWLINSTIPWRFSMLSIHFIATFYTYLYDAYSRVEMLGIHNLVHLIH